MRYVDNKRPKFTKTEGNINVTCILNRSKEA